MRGRDRIAGRGRGGQRKGGRAGHRSDRACPGAPTWLADEVFPAYRAATGNDRRLLGLIALAPEFVGSAPGMPTPRLSRPSGTTSPMSPGRPDVLARGGGVQARALGAGRLPAAARPAPSRRGYQVDRGVRRRHRLIARALILQPDLPFALCVPHHSTFLLRLVAYAARVFSGLPHTTSTSDAGAADSATPAHTVSPVRPRASDRCAGSRSTDHLPAPERDQVRRGLGAQAGPDGFAGRHFVINTAANGRPFTFQQYTGLTSQCRRLRQYGVHGCHAGIPSTWRVSDSRWGLPRTARTWRPGSRRYLSSPPVAGQPGRSVSSGALAATRRNDPPFCPLPSLRGREPTAAAPPR